jgi:hypothetical protein
LITTDDIVDPIAGTAREYATLRDRCWYASARKYPPFGAAMLARFDIPVTVQICVI